MLFLTPSSSRRNVTLLSTEDALRPFCLETRRFVTIDDDTNFSEQYLSGAEAPRIHGHFEEAYASGQLNVFYLRFATPLYDFMYQAETCDVEHLKTPIFDSLVDDPEHLLTMLGEALHYSEQGDIFKHTSWFDADPEEHATSMVATFLWSAAPWLPPMLANHDASESVHTLTFSTPPGDLFDMNQAFRNEWGALYVKAIESWWKLSG